MTDLKMPERPSVRVVLSYILYQVVFLFVLPFAFFRFFRLSRHEPEYAQFLSHRLGAGPVADRDAIWVFAASLGETRACSPVIDELLERGHAVSLTTNTAAGLKEARELYADVDDRIVVRYAPLDFFPFLLAFLARQRPSIGMVVESELWPGYLLLTRWMGVPMVHINGNLLDISVDRDLNMLGGLRLEYLRLYHAITTSTETYKARYVRGRVDPERVFLVGDLKFDQRVNRHHLAAGETQRALWSPDAPVIMIASSVEDEEDLFLEFVKCVLAHETAPKILWAPRSPGRFDAVTGKLADLDEVVRRSEALDAGLDGVLPTDARILAGDSIGEMNFYYQMSDLVIVGATFAPLGGHNIIEALVLKRPVATGPSIYGITFPAEDAAEAGALYIAEDIDDLTNEVRLLLSDDQALKAFRERAASFAEAHYGASRRTLESIAGLLPEPRRDQT